MKLAEKRSEKEFRMIDADGRRKAVTKHSMNCKADKRLIRVAKAFEDVMSGFCKPGEQQFLCKALELQNCDPLKQLLLLYDVENRFASISYNLLIQTFLKAEETKAYRFELQYDGLIRVREAKFVCSSQRNNQWSGREREILDTLNEDIILKKVKALNLLQVVLKYSLSQRCWQIGIKSMAGSATWILIPPVMNLIMPNRQEIYSLIELMRMLASAVC